MFTLQSVVPWGRSLEEYRLMFNLSEQDLARSIVDCGGGPSSFTAELTERGGHVVACDPVYQFTAQEIQQRVEETYHTILEGVYKTKEHFVWDTITSPEYLGEIRLAAMRRFIADYDEGCHAGRYIQAELPHLPFDDQQFDLALCSHFLFTYSDQLSETFHIQSICEMCRVAKEVRIFPLMNSFSSTVSKHLESVVQLLQNQGYTSQVENVQYEFQRGGNKLLKVVKNIEV
jgi:SAM-dependent methyltransferase